MEVGNRVWLDSDSDGIQDAGEAGINDIEVKLVCGADEATTTTSNGGQFTFTNAAGGNAAFMDFGESCVLSIDEAQTALTGYGLTSGNADDITDNNPLTDLRDSDATDNNGTSEITFTVGGAGENNHSMDFGFTVPVLKIGDYVWYDFNQDGIQNQGESGLADIPVYLHDTTDCSGNEIAGTTTSPIGWYEFSGLSSGQDYCIRIDYPNNWTLSPKDSGGNDTLDSDLTGINSSTGHITGINTLADNLTYDAGLHHSDVACQSPTPASGITGVVNNNADWANQVRNNVQFGELIASGWSAEEIDAIPLDGQQYSLQTTSQQSFSTDQLDNLSRVFRLLSDPAITNAVIIGFDSAAEHERFNEVVQAVIWYYTDWNKNFNEVITLIDAKGWQVTQATAMKSLAQLIINKTEGLNGEVRYEPMAVYYLWNEDDTGYQDLIVPGTLITPQQKACLRVDLELTKSIDKATAKRGDTVIYTLMLINKGPDKGNGILVEDQLPDALAYAGSLATQGSYSVDSGIWTVGTLPVDTPIMLEITTTVK